MENRPDRMWSWCYMDAEGYASCGGYGLVNLFEEFTISANGLLIDVVVTQVDWPIHSWTAQDIRSLRVARCISSHDSLDN